MFSCAHVCIVQLKFQYPIDLKISFFRILENRLRLSCGTVAVCLSFNLFFFSFSNKIQIIEMFGRVRWDDIIIHSRIIIATYCAATYWCMISDMACCVLCSFRLLKTTISNNNKWMDTNVRVRVNVCVCV